MKRLLVLCTASTLLGVCPAFASVNSFYCQGKLGTSTLLVESDMGFEQGELLNVRLSEEGELDKQSFLTVNQDTSKKYRKLIKKNFARYLVSDEVSPAIFLFLPTVLEMKKRGEPFKGSLVYFDAEKATVSADVALKCVVD